MNNDYIKVNIGELENIKNEIEQKGNKLIELLQKTLVNTELTKDCFDSLAGNAFREEVTNYLNGRIEYIKNSYLPLANKMNSIINDYTSFSDSTKESIGDNE